VATRFWSHLSAHDFLVNPLRPQLWFSDVNSVANIEINQLIINQKLKKKIIKKRWLNFGVILMAKIFNHHHSTIQSISNNQNLVAKWFIDEI